MAGDSNFNNVSLLLPFDGPSGSTTHIDRSLVRKTITNSLNAVVSSAQSKFNGTSLILNGINESLSTPTHSDFNFGTGDFTIELWVWGTKASQVSDFPRILANGVYLASGAWNLVLLKSTGSIFFDTYNGSTTNGTFVGSLVDSQWNHIAVSRQSGTLRAFINGALSTTNANTQDLTGAYATTIGSEGTSFFKGYIDDLRITKGLARYTAAFTPSTEPNPVGYVTVLDTSYSTVSLLINADGSTLVDESPSPKTLTAVGNAALSKVNSRVGAGSLLFDGAGDYIEVTDSSDFDFGTGDFTLECWYYPLSVSGAASYRGLICQRTNANSNHAFSLFVNQNNLGFGFAFTLDGSTNNEQYFGSALTVNTWYHVAVSRVGANLYFAVNGTVTTATGSASAIFNSSVAAQLGRLGTYTLGDLHGYLDSVRVTKGVARYTANFTAPGYVLSNSAPIPVQQSIAVQGQIPIFPIAFENEVSQGILNLSGHSPIVNTAGGDVYFSDVVLLLPFDGSNGSTTFTDYSLYSRTISGFGDAKIETSNSMFGGSSLFLDGVADYLTTPSSTELQITSGDFTIEAWVYKASSGSAKMVMIKGIATFLSEFALFIDTNGYVNFGIGVGANQSWFYNTTTSVPNGAWRHVAVTKSGSQIYIFINGVSLSLNAGGVLSTPTETNTTALYIGREPNDPGKDWPGYLEDVRITKGVARYTSTFPVPTLPNPTNPPAGLLYAGQSPITFFGQTPFYDNGLSINIIDSFSTSSSISDLTLIRILENLIIDKVVPTSFNVNNRLEDTFRLADLVSVIFREIIPELLLYSDSNEAIISRIESLLESIDYSLSLDNKVIYSSFITDLIRVLDDLLKYLGADVTESLVVSDLMSLLYSLHSLIVESQEYSSIASASYINILSLSESIESSDQSYSSAILSALSSDNFIIELSKDRTGTYLAYLLSPETNSVSTYNNYNFNGCTKFGYKYLFYNRSGLYEYGGNTDDGSVIRSEMETVAFNFKTSNLKQVPSIYLGVDSSDKVILKVRVDGKAEVLYQLNKFTNNLMTQKIDIGKGLIGRYFQFELITEASEFNMESIEFYPLEIRRKL